METTTHRHDPGDHQHAFDTAEMVEYAEMDGDVLQDLVVQAVDVVAGVSEQRGLDVTRVVDIGSGPGSGTIALARAFPAADIVAVDASQAMLTAVEKHAETLDEGHRISTVLAGLPGGLSQIGSADVVWASQVLHHIDDADIHSRLARLLRPDGILAIIEPAGPMKVTTPEPDHRQTRMWRQLEGAWQEWFHDQWGNGSTVLGDGVTGAVLEIVTDVHLTTELSTPLSQPARRYVSKHLLGMRSNLSDHTDTAISNEFSRFLDEVIDGDLMVDHAIVTAYRSLVVACLPQAHPVNEWLRSEPAVG